MDVQCERCKTEYEFDDALVSGRGTIVRCTTCGHQFKVRGAMESGGDQPWVVTTQDRQRITFHTLRDLQQAILSKQVRRSDLLQRGAGPGRPLSEITELEPFLEGRTSNRPPSPDPSSSEPAPPMAFPKRAASWEQTSREAQGGLVDGASGAGALSASGPMRGHLDTLRPALTGGAAPPPPPANVAEPRVIISPSVDVRGPGGPFAPPEASSAQAWEDTGLAGASEPPRRPIMGGGLGGLRDGGALSYDEPYSAPRRRRVGGWIVAASLLLAVGVVGWGVAKPYLVDRVRNAPAQLDPRALSFLSQGERAMSDGNLDAAQEAFDKASALSEHDPRVLLDQARVTAAKADVPWLNLRLLPPDAVDEIRTAKAQLDELVSRVRRQADEALSAAPEDLSAVRVKIDALRLSGDRDGARGYVSKVAGQSSQPEMAYVLAALDLAEPSPLWGTVLERLRLAAGAEGNAGRARAALIYALAKSGDASGAKAELSRLDVMARPYPLLPSLRAFVDKQPGLVADRGPVPAAVTGSAPPAPSHGPSTSEPAVSPGQPAAEVLPRGDARAAMLAAAAAVKKGDFARARQAYQSILDRNPNDSEAVAGLGDIARLQGDAPGAISEYKRAIAINPSYLPALLGLADTQWSRGERASAARTYTDVVDRFPEGTYPAYVPQRIAGASGAATAKPAEPGPATGPASPTPAASEAHPE